MADEETTNNAYLIQWHHDGEWVAVKNMHACGSCPSELVTSRPMDNKEIGHVISRAISTGKVG